MDKQSYIQHDSEYVQPDKFDIESKHHEDHNKDNFKYMYQDYS